MKYIILIGVQLLFVVSAFAQTWTPPVAVDISTTGGTTGVPAAMLIIDGKPAVVYASASALKFVQALDAAGTSWGEPVLISPVSIVKAISFQMIAGNPAVAFIDVNLVKFTDFDGIAWNEPIIVPTVGAVPLGLSLKEVVGTPAIAYTIGGLRIGYIRATNSGGTLWANSVSIDGSTVAYYPSLEVVNGFPSISYYSGLAGDLKFIQSSSITGASWLAASKTVDANGNTGISSSMRIVDGNPAITYLDATNKDLKYVRASNINGTTWSAPLTIETSDAQFPFMQIVNGNPSVTYYDGTNGKLKFIRATNSSGTSWASANEITNVSLPTGDFVSTTCLQVVNGNPAVVFYDLAGSRVKYSRASTAAGTGWSSPFTFNTASPVGKNISLQIVEGNPAMCYTDFGNGTLRFTRALDRMGQTWGTPVTLQVPPNGETAGEYASMQIVNGMPAVAFYQGTGNTGKLKYVIANNALGGSWGTPMDVDAIDLPSGPISLQVVNGNPAISYNSNEDLKFVRATNSNGTTWSTPETIGVAGVVEINSALCVASGNPAIVYSASGEYRFVRATNAQGTAWGLPVTIGLSAVSMASVQIVNGVPAIAFHYRGLKYVYAQNAFGTVWSGVINIDDDTKAGQYPSLSVINGKPAISYYDQNTTNLEFVAANDLSGSSWSSPVVIGTAEGERGMFSSMVPMGYGAGIAHYYHTKLRPEFVVGLVNPTITSFTPVDGGESTVVTINGTSFSPIVSNNSVKFNGTTGTVLTASATSITARVPSGVSTGPIRVEVSPGAASNSLTDFVVKTTISSVSPGGGAMGESIVITGTNFNTTNINNVVKFNGTSATVVSSSPTALTVSIPNGATTGKITVTSNGQTATTVSDFIIRANEPGFPPSNLLFSSITASSMNISFSPATGSPAGYIVLRKQGSSPTELPADGQTYSIGEDIGSSKVISVGTTVSASNSGLASNTGYYFDVLSYNGSGNTINYRTSTRLEGNKLTAPILPTLTVANATTTLFQSSWNTVPGASNYLIDVSTVNNFATFVGEYNSKSITGTSVTISPLQPDTEYFARIRAVNSEGTPSAYSEVKSIRTQIVAGLNNQTITFNPLPIKTSGDAAFALSATSSSGLAVSYSSSNPSVATISGNTVTITGFGTTIITASQAGNASYNPATSVEQTLIVRATEPAAQPTVLKFTSVTANAVGGSFTPSSATGYLVLRSTSEITDMPSDGTVYPTAVGTATVVSSGSSTSFSSSGLSPNIKYFFAVFAYNGNDAAINYNIVSPLSGDVVTQELTLSPLAFTNSATATISTTITGGSGTRVVKFFHRPIRSKAFTEQAPTVSGNAFSYTITASLLDEVGIEFYFTASDATTPQPITTSRGFIYKPIAQSIPDLSAGGQPENYRIISIPATLPNTSPREVFNSALVQFGSYDINQWRLMRYEPGEPKGRNVDFEAITQIQPGLGYWFNSLSKVDITINGTAVQKNQSAPFQIELKKGWNQIGNPFTFNVKWSDILAANQNPAGVGSKYYTYDASRISFKESTDLTPWSGGFVKATAATTITIPVTIGLASASRVDDYYEIANRQIDLPGWFLPLHVTHGTAYNNMGGIGMHPEASAGNDRFDEHSLPRFQNYLELNSYHEDFFIPRFTRDVVTTDVQHEWKYVVESNFGSSSATITWDKESIGRNDAQLKLYDEEAGELIDMKETGSYTFHLSAPRKLRIYFSIDEAHFKSDISGIGKPFPNPFSHDVTIPFFSGDQSQIDISVYDLIGRKIRTITRDQFKSGFYQSSWDGNDEQGNRVSTGIYVYRFSSSDRKPVTGRIVVK